MKPAMALRPVEMAPDVTSLEVSSGAPAVRRLWLCADDYGMAPGVSRAIRELVTRERLNATSVMVVSPNFSTAEADTLASACGELPLAIGLHFTLTAPFRPLTAGYRPTDDGTFLDLRRSFATGLLRRLDTAALRAEAEAQLAAFQKAFGRPPDFVDGHQHVHLLPQVADALIAAIKVAAPRAMVRQCGRAMPLLRRLRDPKGQFLDGLSRRLRAVCAAAGLATNPVFAGTYAFRPDADYAALFPSFLENMPDGGLVMCHPGFVDAELRDLDVLTELREREFRFFVGEEFPRSLAGAGFALA
jgi:predicted glycoside hydrolase/deacetylase ChbG (UPF0249 family)